VQIKGGPINENNLSKLLVNNTVNKFLVNKRNFQLVKFKVYTEKNINQIQLYNIQFDFFYRNWDLSGSLLYKIIIRYDKLINK